MTESPRIEWTDRVLIVAPSNGGKSTIARYLIACARAKRLIVVDPKGEYQLGVTPVKDAAGASRAARAGAIVHVTPDDPDDRDAMETLYGALWSLAGPLLWVEDEAAETTKQAWSPQGLRRCARMGRAHRKLLMCCTQRMAECHPIVRTQATHVIILTPAPAELDLKPIAAHISVSLDALRGRLEDLHLRAGPFSHLWWCSRSRELIEMSAVPVVSWPGVRSFV